MYIYIYICVAFLGGNFALAEGQQPKRCRGWLLGFQKLRSALKDESGNTGTSPQDFELLNISLRWAMVLGLEPFTCTKC